MCIDVEPVDIRKGREKMSDIWFLPFAVGFFFWIYALALGWISWFTHAVVSIGAVDVFIIWFLFRKGEEHG